MYRVASGQLAEAPVHLGRSNADLHYVPRSVPKVNSTLPFAFPNITWNRSRKLGAHRAHQSVYYWKSCKSQIWACLEPGWINFNTYRLSLKLFIVRQYIRVTVAPQRDHMIWAYSTRILVEDPRALDRLASKWNTVAQSSWHKPQYHRTIKML